MSEVTPGSALEREPILPTTADKSEWTNKEKLAFVWVLDRVALETMYDALDGIPLDEDQKGVILTAFAAGRLGFMGYIQDLVGESLTTQETGQALWEVGRTIQEMDQ